VFFCELRYFLINHRFESFEQRLQNRGDNYEDNEPDYHGHNPFKNVKGSHINYGLTGQETPQVRDTSGLKKPRYDSRRVDTDTETGKLR